MNTSKHYNLTAFHHNLARLPAGRYPSARDDSKYLTPTPYRSMPTRTPRAVHFPASRTSPRRAASWPSCAEATSPTGPRRGHVSHRTSPEIRFPQAFAVAASPAGFRRSYVFLQNWPRKRRKTELRRKRGAPSLGLLRATAPRAPRSPARRNAHSPRTSRTAGALPHAAHKQQRAARPRGTARHLGKHMSVEGLILAASRRSPFNNISVV